MLNSQAGTEPPFSFDVKFVFHSKGGPPMAKKQKKQPEKAVNSVAMSSGRESQKLSRKDFEKELFQLHAELVKLQEWVKSTGYRAIILFEGRDAAGKG